MYCIDNDNGNVNPIPFIWLFTHSKAFNIWLTKYFNIKSQIIEMNNELDADTLMEEVVIERELSLSNGIYLVESFQE